MNRRFQFSVVAGSTCVVALLLFGAVRGHSASTDNPYNNLGVYSEVLSKIKLEYVEEPDMKAVTLGAINGMLESIDPYASYLNADQYKQYQKTKDTKKGDIGLVLSKRFGYMGVVDALPGSPAAKAWPASPKPMKQRRGVLWLMAVLDIVVGECLRNPGQAGKEGRLQRPCYNSSTRSTLFTPARAAGSRSRSRSGHSAAVPDFPRSSAAAGGHRRAGTAHR